MTCPVVNVYSANFSVRSITYLEKKIWLIIINKIITFVIVLVLICKHYYFSELWKFVNGCTLMTLLKSHLKIYLNFGCILYMEHHFFLHFTPNFGGAYYTKVHITHKPVQYSLIQCLQFFNAMSYKNFWQFVTCYCS